MHQCSSVLYAPYDGVQTSPAAVMFMQVPVDVPVALHA